MHKQAVNRENREGPLEPFEEYGNAHAPTVEGFGDEWSRFDQSRLGRAEVETLFDRYFRIFPWDLLPAAAVGMDVGCGSGRWAKLVAPRVGKLHCLDASREALDVAERNLNNMPNVAFVLGTADRLPFEDSSLDFGYSLGVLHHIPDTMAGLRACARALKPDAPFLVYLYYAFDNRPAWFRALWRISDGVRRVVSSLPHGTRKVVTDVVAALVYFPFARSAAVLRRLGADVSTWPLSAYSETSFFTMRTDSRDRFGTALEKRFTREQITRMMTEAGFERLKFSDEEPYWCCVAYRSAAPVDGNP